MEATAQYLQETIDNLLPLLEKISEEEASLKPIPNKWSKKEIIGHLIDSACNNQQKFVRMMAQPHLDFVGYKQDFWVANQHYNESNWQTLIKLWYAYNSHLAHVIRHTNPTFLHNTISIEGSDLFTLEFIMNDYVEHLKHHMKKILLDIPIESKFMNVYNA